MKSILITGAASGIGAATVKKLASKRVCFTLTTKSNLEGLISVKQFAEHKGAKVSYICGDLSERKFLEKTCQTVVVNFFKFQFLKNSKFSFAFFEESGHFWTWKMQNLKSRHQH